MKYKLYFFLHFYIIGILALNSVVYSYMEYQNIKNTSIENFNDILNTFRHNSIYNIYAILTGTNTGYGFYGINVATNKFFVVELYDSNDKIIHKTSTFGFKNKSNLQRFNVFSSKTANYIAELNKENNKKSKATEMKEKLTKKYFKYIGLREVEKYDNCKYYIVKLYTIIPDDIWENKNYFLSKNVGEYKSYKFEL
ncbi:hypothetical protein GO491_04380 [Flavobacteriaceae bacterium Ap0902]|nr:hypothetical protein [Flavobacteriaceae bacterium Ap0902]